MLSLGNLASNLNNAQLENWGHKWLQKKRGTLWHVHHKVVEWKNGYKSVKFPFCKIYGFMYIYVYTHMTKLEGNMSTLIRSWLGAWMMCVFFFSSSSVIFLKEIRITYITIKKSKKERNSTHKSRLCCSQLVWFMASILDHLSSGTFSVKLKCQLGAAAME